MHAFVTHQNALPNWTIGNWIWSKICCVWKVVSCQCKKSNSTIKSMYYTPEPILFWIFTDFSHSASVTVPWTGRTRSATTKCTHRLNWTNGISFIRNVSNEMQNPSVTFCGGQQLVCVSTSATQFCKSIDIFRFIIRWKYSNCLHPFICSVEIPDDRPQTIIQEIRKCYDNKPRLIMNLLQSASSSTYTAIKRLCYVQLGIASQVLCAKTIDPKKAMSVATKVAIQINAKLGGAPWMIGEYCVGECVIAIVQCVFFVHRYSVYWNDGCWIRCLSRFNQ